MDEATLDLHVFVLDALMAMKGDKAASDFVEQRMQTYCQSDMWFLVKN